MAGAMAGGSVLRFPLCSAGPSAAIQFSALTAIFCLALGIGANTTIFNIAAVFFPTWNVK